MGPGMIVSSVGSPVYLPSPPQAPAPVAWPRDVFVPSMAVAAEAKPSVAVARPGALNCEPFRMTHDLQVDLDPARGTMTGDDRMTVSRVPSDGAVGFRLDPGLEIRDIQWRGQRLAYRRQDDRIHVDLSGACDPGDATRIRVRYEGAIPGKENGPGAPGVYLYDETLWHPNHMGEHDESRLTVTVPADWQATASGDETADTVADGRRSYTWETPWAGSGLSLAAAHYDVTARQEEGIAVRTFLFPTSNVDADRLVKRSGDVLRFFQPLFGPYPYDRLDVVESTSEFAEGTPGTVMFNDSVLKDTDELDDFLAHEISHNWWAGALAGYSDRGIWYEAFAEFSANLFTRGAKDSPKSIQERDAILQEWHDKIGAGGATPVRDANDYSDWDRTELVAYYKGAFVLDMLRDKLGDDAFFSGMRTFVANNSGSFPDWNDAQAAFEQASGKDLSKFFTQWLDRPDAPRLALQQVSVASVPGGWQVQGQVLQTQSGEPYELDLPVVIKTQDGQLVRKTIPLGAEPGAFQWTLPSQPASVQIDPEARIFRLKGDAEEWSAPRAMPPVTLAMG